MTNSPVIVKLGAHIGARVDGVRLDGDLDRHTVTAINDALLTHKVIFFRGQHHVDDDTQLAVARTLGTPTLAHPTGCHAAPTCCPSTPGMTRPTPGTPTSRSSTACPRPPSCAPSRCRVRGHHDVGVDRGGL